MYGPCHNTRGKNIPWSQYLGCRHLFGFRLQAILHPYGLILVVLYHSRPRIFFKIIILVGPARMAHFFPSNSPPFAKWINYTSVYTLPQCEFYCQLLCHMGSSICASTVSSSRLLVYVYMYFFYFWQLQIPYTTSQFQGFS